MAERAPLLTIRSTCVVLPTPNIDTDQIIPARFLKVTDKAGLGEALFADWRYAEDGTPRAEFPLNRTEARGAEILVAGHNFGCGSSREHAPWALHAYGFRAVISTRFADIFHGNALKNGLLPITVPTAVHEWLMAELGARADSVLSVDVEAQALTMPDGSVVTFPIDPFAKHCLLTGVDELGFLLGLEADIAAYEGAHPGRVMVVP
jgi:3-isopropylmalate/(R)-2-methylmalate dehydratase small subunit